MTETGESQELEPRVTDNDLNAVEAWCLSSSHPIIFDGDEDPQKTLEALYKSDRNKALTPRNVLLGVREVDAERRARQKPYTDGLLALFGPEYMFGYQHEISLGDLNDEGLPDQMGVKVTREGQLVDAKKLVPVQQFSVFLEKAGTGSNGEVILKFK